MITHFSGEVNIACSTPAGMMLVGSPATARAKSVPTTQATSPVITIATAIRP